MLIKWNKEISHQKKINFQIKIQIDEQESQYEIRKSCECIATVMHANKMSEWTNERQAYGRWMARSEVNVCVSTHISNYIY